jgi:hypothetical protein
LNQSRKDVAQQTFENLSRQQESLIHNLQRCEHRMKKKGERSERNRAGDWFLIFNVSTTPQYYSGLSNLRHSGQCQTFQEIYTTRSAAVEPLDSTPQLSHSTQSFRSSEALEILGTVRRWTCMGIGSIAVKAVYGKRCLFLPCPGHLTSRKKSEERAEKKGIRHGDEARDNQTKAVHFVKETDNYGCPKLFKLRLWSFEPETSEAPAN